jgi:large subunit ribosomal protein L20
MPRVKHAPASKKRKKKVLKSVKGARGGRSKLIRTAKETANRAMAYAYRDRKVKKREYRALWITRITAACKKHSVSYSKFINGLLKAKVALNRKMLAEIAATDDTAFAKLVKLSKESAK